MRSAQLLLATPLLSALSLPIAAQEQYESHGLSKQLRAEIRKVIREEVRSAVRDAVRDALRDLSAGKAQKTAKATKKKTGSWVGEGVGDGKTMRYRLRRADGDETRGLTFELPSAKGKNVFQGRTVKVEVEGGPDVRKTRQVKVYRKNDVKKGSKDVRVLTLPGKDGKVMVRRLDVDKGGDRDARKTYKTDSKDVRVLTLPGKSGRVMVLGTDDVGTKKVRRLPAAKKDDVGTKKVRRLPAAKKNDVYRYIRGGDGTRVLIEKADGTTRTYSVHERTGNVRLLRDGHADVDAVIENIKVRKAQKKDGKHEKDHKVHKNLVMTLQQGHGKALQLHSHDGAHGAVHGITIHTKGHTKGVKCSTCEGECTCECPALKAHGIIEVHAHPESKSAKKKAHKKQAQKKQALRRRIHL